MSGNYVSSYIDRHVVRYVAHCLIASSFPVGLLLLLLVVGLVGVATVLLMHSLLALHACNCIVSLLSADVNAAIGCDVDEAAVWLLYASLYCDAL